MIVAGLVEKKRRFESLAKMQERISAKAQERISAKMQERFMDSLREEK
jgi:hypothetical protein